MKSNIPLPASVPLRRRKTIGFVFQYTDDSYEHTIWKSVVKQAELHDVNLLCISTGAMERGTSVQFDYRKRDILDIIDPDRIDGFILLTAVYLNSYSVSELNSEFASFLGKPCVTIGGAIPGFPDISVDNVTGMREIMEHLIRDHGYRKIGFVRGSSSNPDFEARFETYKTVLKENAIPADEKAVLDASSQNTYFSGTTDSYDEFIRRNGDLQAIVCASDYMAVNIARKLRENELAVPGQIAVTGFDDSDEGKTFFPPLTSVRQPVYEMGEKAFCVLMDAIEGKPCQEKIILSTHAVIRRSCGCFPFSVKRFPLITCGEENAGGSDDSLLHTLSGRMEKIFDTSFGGKVLSEISSSRASALATAVLDDLRSGTDSYFPEAFSAFAESVFSCGIDVFALNRVIAELFEMLKSTCDCAAGSTWFDENLERAKYIVEEMAAGKMDYSESKRGVADINYITSILNSSMSVDELADNIMEYYPRYGFLSCFMALYTDDSRHKARLVAAFDKKTDYRLQDKTGVFDSFRIVPEELDLFARRKSYFVTSLFYNDTPLGYILLEIDFIEGNIYELLPFEVSQIIHAIRLMEKIRNHNIELTRKVEEKTRELSEANEQLKELDRLKNEFIANISHDFRSPLTVILNLSELALDYDDSISEKTKEKFRSVYNASLRLKSTIDKLLDLARMDAKGMRLKIEPVDVLQYLHSLVEYYSSSVIASGIRIVARFPERIDSLLYTDRDKLEEILDNIMSNAIKFVDHHIGEICVSAEESNDSFTITISDNGIGIPADKIDSIFKRFEQVHEGVSRFFGGTGIGLAFAVQLASLLQGELTAHSEGEGRGARFTLRLKKGKEHFGGMEIAEPEKDARRKNDMRSLIRADMDERMQTHELLSILPELNVEGELDYRKGLILIIDDDKSIREIVMTYLSANGFRNFIVAADSRQGLDAVYEYSPDVIICDYNMPHIKGDEIHNRLAGNPLHCAIPFIFLSALADERVILERRQIGAAAYLKKPIDKNLFVLTVQEQLKKRFEYRKIARKATIDELTQVNNRQALIEHLNRELSARNFRDFSLIFFDVDNFKSINDEYGHQTGDRILSGIGRALQAAIRKSDIAGRYGGDEFVVLLPDTGLGNAVHVANELREAVCRERFVSGTAELFVTSSFGVASLKDNAAHIERELGIESISAVYDVADRKNADWTRIEMLKQKTGEVLLAMADAMLYEAKTGRCNGCGFVSKKRDSFKEGRCPSCGSIDIVPGRNRVKAFPPHP